MKLISFLYPNSLRIDFGSALLRGFIPAGVSACFGASLIAEELSIGERAILRMHPVAEKRMSVFEKDFPDRSSVWLVSNPGTGARAYLAGTVHSLRTADLPLPSPFYAAYHEADVIVTESGSGNAGAGGGVDQAQLKAWTQKNRRHLTLRGGHSVETLLRTEVVQALKEHLGADFGGLRKKSPFILYMKVLQRQTHQLAGMEDVMVVQAKRDGKRILRLDSDEVHRTALKVMDELLQSYLTQVEERGIEAVFIEAMKESSDPVFSLFYRKGDEEAMNAVYEARKRAGGLFGETLPARNRQWVEKIAGMLGADSPQVEYVLVGGGHLGGDGGLLQLLRDKGFILQPLFGVDRPDGGKE